MQCLYGTNILVNEYLNLANDDWVNTIYNRRLKEFFEAYRGGSSPFDPLPFVEEALLLEHKNFDYLYEQDPSVALKQIIHALTFSQCKYIKELQGEEPKPVKLSDTPLGKLFTTEIYSSSKLMETIFSNMSNMQKKRMGRA